MFLKLVGLSLIVHFVVIICGTIVNKIRGTQHQSAFQTHGKKGGAVRSPFVNSLLSVMILAGVISYTGILFYTAVSTSLELGATEPQVIFLKSVFAAVGAFLVAFFSGVEGIVVVAAALLSWMGFRFMARRRILATVNETAPITPVTHSGLVPAISFVAILAFVARLGIGAAIGAALFSVPLWASAQIIEPGFQREVIANGFALPTATAFTPDGRIFVAEKNGVVKVVKNGAVLATPLITLTDINTFGDRGLIGMAVDPNFATNGYVYLSYTYENTPGLNVAGPKTARIVRVTVVGDVASESSKFVLVGTEGGNATSPSCEDFAVTDDCIASDSNSHSAGALAFGPDGNLYASTGDGADFAAVDSRALRAQNVDSLAGKVLRINTDGSGPSDNPFYNGDPNSNRSKVFALGFRNQFRLHFNQATGKLYGGDVGWSSWEEVNDVVAGGNYGWPCREGAATQPQYACTPSSATTDPLYTYAHDSNGAGSIVLGAFPTSNAYPNQYDNTLFIGDYAQQWVKQLNLDASGTLVSVTDFEIGGVFPVELSTGNDGHVYYIDIAFGTLNRLTHTNGNRKPTAVAAATPTSGLTPLTVDFSSAGSFDPDGDAIGFAWNFGDGTFAATANPSHTYTQNGSYDATLVVSDVNGATDAITITITVGDQKPAAQITTPANGSFYRPFDNVMVMGDATDPEDGTLPASAFDWTVLLHHNVHTHTVQQFSGTKMITFVADNHNDPDVYMEILLTVTDSAGLTDTTSINMYYNNSATGTANIVPNPSVEIADPLRPAPQDWYNGWFGQMNTVYTYPAIGMDGNSAVQTDVTGYVSGTSKWFFTPVFVEGGATYTFSDVYKSTAVNHLTIRYERNDGSVYYAYLDTLPAAADPTTTSYDIVVPADAVNMTVYHELASNGTLITDAYSLVKQTTTDNNPPTGSITNISDGDVLSGTVTIDITATDAEGPVTKVHLYVDGAKFQGLEDTTVPFNLDWDTTQVADGQHVIQTHMHDLVDNHGLSAPITITVDNSSGTTTGQNLIQNGGFEIAGPANWAQGGWGANTRVHTIDTGRTSSNAAKVEITNYPVGDIGDAKWVHDNVAVTSGRTYTFETYYHSDTISDIIGRYTYGDGSVSYFGLIKEIQPTTNWTYLTNTFVPPIGAQEVTFFHLISSEGYVSIDDVALYDNNATGTPSEANAPQVNWISPSDGDTINGTVTFTTNATDDTAVVGVYYAINGNPFGVEQPTAPYNLNWDTTTVADGVYTLKATAHDPYGNNAADTITVTVDNSGVPPTGTSTNLIANPDLEIAGGNNSPAGWFQGGWGTNNRNYSYPVPGVSGDAARIDMTSFTSGDAKWYFTDVVVTPGTTYPFAHSYRSNVATELVARFTKNDSSVQYQFLTSLPASQTWTQSAVDIIVPTDVVSVTVFHNIAAIGFLETDSFSLGGTGGGATTTDTVAPTVTQSTLSDGQIVNGVVTVNITATDNVAVSNVDLLINNAVIATDSTAPYTANWDTASQPDGQYQVAVRATDTSNNETTTAAITVTVDNSTGTSTNTNLVVNGDFESSTAGAPDGWNQGGWGTNDRVHTYPVAGVSGEAARIEINNFTSGDAKWYFDDIAITGGSTYEVTVDHQNDIAGEIVVRYTMTDSSVIYDYLAALPVAGGWNTTTTALLAPTSAVSLTIFNLIDGVGYLEIDTVSVVEL